MGLWCRCGAYWPPRRMVMTERRECLFYRNGVTACTRAAPCVPCLVARSRVVERVGLDFPAWGVWVQEAVTANA